MRKGSYSEELVKIGRDEGRLEALTKTERANKR